MASFKQYLVNENNRISDEIAKNATMKKADKEDTIEDVVYNANPAVWTGRIVNNRKYLIYNGKYLDLTSLKDELTRLYTSKGYPGYGFAKLDEHDLIRYTKVKNILMKVFESEINDFIDPASMAEIMFMNEFKEFDWKPEEY